MKSTVNISSQDLEHQIYRALNRYKDYVLKYNNEIFYEVRLKETIVEHIFLKVFKFKRKVNVPVSIEERIQDALNNKCEAQKLSILKKYELICNEVKLSGIKDIRFDIDIDDFDVIMSISQFGILDKQNLERV